VVSLRRLAEALDDPLEDKLVQHKAFAFAGVIVAGCSVGAPPGFSGESQWTFPLVGPLEDGLLVTPVSVHGHGPYLFAIDPDANVTAIDQHVVKEAGLIVSTGPHRIDEAERGQTRFYAEVLDLKIAGLTIDRRKAMVFPDGLYDTEGRHLNGILGRDVIADSLVFGFDRDQGIATLATVKAFHAPPGAIALPYEAVSSRSSSFIASTAGIGAERSAGDSLPRGGSGPQPGVDPANPDLPPGPVRTAADLSRIDHNNFEREHASSRPASLGDVTPVPRRLARAKIGDATVAMHLDLGAAASQLPEATWRKAGLAAVELKLRLVDEAASTREVTRVGIAPEVMLGAVRAEHVTFVPFTDKRWGTEGVDGALGLNFFRPYAVYASWDNSTYYLKPRGDAAATTVARLGRWGADLPACEHPGCVSVELASREAGVVLHVTRDPEVAGRALEVYFAVTPVAGRSAPPLVIELPGSAAELTTGLPGEYAGATFTVLDAAPFARSCAGDGGCIVQLGSIAAPDAAAAPGVPLPAPELSARTVSLDTLHRRTGAPAIPPSDDVQQAAAGKPVGAAIVKVCMTLAGKVGVTKIVKSSGVAAYDAQVQRTIEATWTFDPVAIDGKPAPVCTQVTFLAPGP
jgi:hypothetical protein